MQLCLKLSSWEPNWWPSGPSLFFGFLGNRVDEAPGATAQHRLAEGKGLGSGITGLGLPVGMPLIALAFGGFLLRNGHLRTFMPNKHLPMQPLLSSNR